MNNQKLACKPGEGKQRNLLVCTLDIGAQAGRHISEPLKLLVKGAYKHERTPLHKWLDLAGLLVIGLTVFGLIWLLSPRTTPDLIIVDAAIAPTEIITGGSSTLTFRFENRSDETITDTKLTFTVPEHFLLSAIESDVAQEVGFQTFQLGDIAPGQYGFIHVKGTMFGDVGGEQTFTTELTYTYGEDQKTDTKIIEHTFSPTASTLELALTLPEYLVAYQLVEGTISYRNTGDVAFPDMTIEPNWPSSFTLISSNPNVQTDGAFHVRGIEPGEEGIITFTGRLGTPDDSIFRFSPSFAFDDTRYAQRTLTDTINILPPPLTISHAFSSSTLQPGDVATVTLFYNNKSQYTLTDVALGLTSDTNVFADELIFSDAPTTIAPGDSGELTRTVPVRSSLSRTSLTAYENILVNTRGIATFTFSPDGTPVEIDTTGSVDELRLTSPIFLESFGRYWTASGDQLGRGPLPPIVGETTKYWIFWNVSGTTNELSGLTLEADLGPGVTLTGRQSVSVGTSIESINGSVRWNVSSIDPTLARDSVVVAAAFEVAITPTADQVGSVATLLQRTYTSARDTWTGATIQTSAGSVTTALTADSKAAAYGGVVEE